MLLYTSTFEIVLYNFAISNLCNTISKSRNLGCAIQNWLAISQFLICAAQFRNCVNLQIAQNIYIYIQIYVYMYIKLYIYMCIYCFVNDIYYCTCMFCFVLCTGTLLKSTMFTWRRRIHLFHSWLESAAVCSLLYMEDTVTINVSSYTLSFTFAAQQNVFHVLWVHCCLDSVNACRFL